MNNINQYLVSFFQLISFVFVMFQFMFLVAPWSSAISIETATQRYGRSFPPEWHGVVMEHGTLHDSPLGVPSDHVFLFYMLVGSLVIIVAYTALTAIIFSKPEYFALRAIDGKGTGSGER